MTTWCIVPLGRPHLLNSALANFSRQLESDKRLVIVRDGDGPPFIQGSVAEVFSGQYGISEALNAGLFRARAEGHAGDTIVKMDDDDWYGPEYLLRIPHGRYSAKASWWVQTESGDMWFCKPRRGLHGSTLAGPIDCPDFRHVDRFGEDTRWIADAGRNRFVELLAGHYLYKRHVGWHSWPVPTDCIPIPGMLDAVSCGTDENLALNDAPPPITSTVHPLPLLERVHRMRSAVSHATG